MLRRWARDARLSLARLPSFPGLARAPSAPVHTIRELWPGNPDDGALLVTGRFRFENRVYTLDTQDWEHRNLPTAARKWLHGFTWLRDLRALGSDEARLCARAIVASWLDQPPIDPLVLDASATGARIAAWMGHYDFFAASADDAFRQLLMDRVLVEGRLIAALLPLPPNGWQNLTAFKGLLAAAVTIPSQTGFLSRFLRYLDQELEHLLLPDGCVCERSPEAQFQAARELAEMSAIMRMAQMPPAESVTKGLAWICPVLRAMRHADGGLALFNGAVEHDQSFIENVLQQGARQRLLAPAMPDGAFWRLSPGKALLIVDAGVPAPSGYDRMAHGGPLSFEFSYGRQRLFVNCGSAQAGAWEQALRETAAHTTMVLDGRSCVDFGPDGGLSRRPAHVTASHQTQSGAHWLDMAHDGYRASLGATWQRRLYINAEGEDLRGQEVVEGEREVSLALRFHLHPSVEAQLSPDHDEVLMHAGGMIWRFRQENGVLSLEESVYFGGEKPVRTLQIVVTAPKPPEPEPEPEVEPESEPEAETALEAEPAVEETENVSNETPSDVEATEGEAENTPVEETENAPPAEGTESVAPQPAEQAPAPDAFSSVPKKSGRQVIQWVMERVPE
ncbi:heparinase II/III family protein [Kozakia baliensis]|uniref:heparinase II/III family protein n=1 Tax=Kozakia baliensis TaxID=153496 RepID=UPI00089DC04B|nr:heparinase II/III family protein [Kozakia baliensis]GBR28106.1 hypothetical protein AA0488_1317 [Kozakia baliensis NRIC 0488]GEL63781.1 heparinase [Kozakia baliensis]